MPEVDLSFAGSRSASVRRIRKDKRELFLRYVVEKTSGRKGRGSDSRKPLSRHDLRDPSLIDAKDGSRVMLGKALYVNEIFGEGRHFLGHAGRLGFGHQENPFLSDKSHPLLGVRDAL